MKFAEYFSVTLSGQGKNLQYLGKYLVIYIKDKNLTNVKFAERSMFFVSVSVYCIKENVSRPFFSVLVTVTAGPTASNLHKG